MNYRKHYALLISKASKRTLQNVYYEKHHIIPKCMNGNDSLSNIVNLLPEEHIVAHRLLSKMYPNNTKLLCAVFCMINGLNKCKDKIKNNKEYRKVRLAYSEMQSKENKLAIWWRLQSDSRKKEIREKIANTVKKEGTFRKENHPLWGRGHTEQARKNIAMYHADCSGTKNSNARSYKFISPEGKEYIVTGEIGDFCTRNSLSGSVIAREMNKGIIYRDWNMPRSTAKSVNTSGWECITLDNKG